MSAEAMEKARIRELVENWALWRDQGDWDRFRSVWHDDGWMMATWFQGPADRFIAVSREGFEQPWLEFSAGVDRHLAVDMHTTAFVTNGVGS